MSEPLRICWATDQEAMFGQAFGYTRANRALKAATLAAGAVQDVEAPLAVHFSYPPAYRPIPGKVNLFFTMYEAPQLPEWFSRRFADCDVLVVPAPWVESVFRRYTDKPIYVVPLGVHVQQFLGVDREPPHPRAFRIPGTSDTLGPTFIWLYVGAHNQRKGWPELVMAWAATGMLHDPRLLLYIKTTPDPTFGDPSRESLELQGNILSDWRVHSDDALHHLYAQADAFVFPTMGEGFGLTLLEAMATALPCVAPLHTGLTTFADRSVCLAVRYGTQRVRFKEYGEEEHWQDAYVADFRDVGRQMLRAMRDWKAAKAMGLRAHARAQLFSWEVAGRRMLAVLREVAAAHGLVG